MKATWSRDVPTPRLCPVCGKDLKEIKYDVETINGVHTRSARACLTCRVKVIVCRLPRSVHGS